MSISKPINHRTAKAKIALVHRASRPQNDSAAFALPPTVSRPALLDQGSDRRFRQLVYDLLTIATRMDALREHLAQRLGISGPQYSVLVAVAQLQSKVGVSVGALAKVLHVTSAFVATETGRLASLGFLQKRSNPDDRRGVLISLTRRGRQQICRLSPEIRAVNDLFFAPLDRRSFAALATAAASLVHGSTKILGRLEMLEVKSTGILQAAE